MQTTVTKLMAQVGDPGVAQVSWSQSEIFNALYWMFLILGTIVGTVVIAYILYNAYKYREDGPTPEGRYDVEATDEDEGVARPQLGEIPTGVGKAGGKKLFLSFAISAVLVVTLVTFSYWGLLLVEGTPSEDDVDALEISVDANSFNYQYEYPSGYETSAGDPLVVPEDRVIWLNVTACAPGECVQDGQTEVWHTWSSPDLQASTDAIPGQFTETWFTAEAGEYRVECRELCGAGHSSMNFDDGDGVVVKEEADFREWCEDEGCMDEEELDEWLETTRGEN